MERLGKHKKNKLQKKTWGEYDCNEEQIKTQGEEMVNKKIYIKVKDIVQRR